jgi:hypothetical protein
MEYANVAELCKRWFFSVLPRTASCLGKKKCSKTKPVFPTNGMGSLTASNFDLSPEIF